MAIKAIPDGLTTVTAFFNIKGAADAIALYKQAFGAEERHRFSTPTGQIMIAELQLGSSVIRIADAVKDPPTQSASSMYFENVDAAFKRATDAGLDVVQPLANMFWGERFGVLKDRFGNRWAMAQRLEELTIDEANKRAAAAGHRTA